MKFYFVFLREAEFGKSNKNIELLRGKFSVFLFLFFEEGEISEKYHRLKYDFRALCRRKIKCFKDCF